jgi:hypothetical protein
MVALAGELVSETRLAHACLAHEGDHLAPARARLAEHAAQMLDLSRGSSARSRPSTRPSTLARISRRSSRSLILKQPLSKSITGRWLVALP